MKNGSFCNNWKLEKQTSFILQWISRMKLSQMQLAIIALIFANLIWGASSPIMKWALQDSEPFTFAFFRFFLSALVLLPFVLTKLKINRQDISMVIFIAVIGVGLRILYYLYGLKFASSINAPIIFSATPIFIIIGSFLLFHEKTKKKVVNGAIISLIGILFIILQPLFGSDANKSLIGNMFFIVSMVLYVFYTFLLRQLAPRYHPLTLLFWIFLIASLAMFPFAGFEMSKHSLFAMFNLKTFLGISFTVIFATCFAYSLQLYGMKYVNASEVGLFIYVDPFAAVAIAHPLLGESITPVFFFGALLVFLGIYIAEGRFHYHPFHLLRRKETPIPAYSSESPITDQDSSKLKE